MTYHRHSFSLLTTLLAFTAAIDGIQRQPQHDGRSHNAAHEVAEARDVIRIQLVKRQSLENGNAGGIESISRQSTSSLDLSATSAQNKSSLPLQSTLYNQTQSLSVTSYAFPTSVVQIPVATVCPDSAFQSAIVSINATTAAPPTMSIVNATALLPNGSSTTFLSTITPTIQSADFANSSSDIPANSTLAAGELEATAARIVEGSNGCQTLYSPSTTAICSTTIRLVGNPDVPVTDCEQFITFSSNNMAASSCPEQTADPRASSTTIAASLDNSPTASGSDLAPNETEQSIYPTSDVPPGTYFAAHWLDVARGGVPTQVRVETCNLITTARDSVSCATESELWSVSSITETGLSTNIASFSGPVVVTAGGQILMTTVSFLSTETVTITTVRPTIVRERLLTPTYAPAAASSDIAGGGSGTVTVQMTMPTTIVLDELTRTTQMTTTVVRTVTNEVEVTLTSTMNG